MSDSKLEPQATFYFATADEAEAAFYSAFEMSDINLMNSLMAEHNVCCVHPNALPIIGREAVLSSWQEILRSIDEPVFYPEVLHRSQEGDTAIHVVAEHIAADHQLGTETALVLATNVYIKQENGWRMMMHHSSMPPHSEEIALENDPSITHSAPETLQ